MQKSEYVRKSFGQRKSLQKNEHVSFAEKRKRFHRARGFAARPSCHSAAARPVAARFSVVSSEKFFSFRHPDPHLTCHPEEQSDEGSLKIKLILVISTEKGVSPPSGEILYRMVKPFRTRQRNGKCRMVNVKLWDGNETLFDRSIILHSTLYILHLQETDRLRRCSGAAPARP